ncbi:MAG: tetratricopeptide repeat protein, partial [Bdellovibrionota bacterium]
SVQEGRAKKKSQNYPAAIQLFRAVLKDVPEHPIAAIELGLIEGLEFNHLDDGLNLLKPALEGSEKVPGWVRSNGLYGLAQIYERKGENKKALQYATQSFEANPTNQEAKALVIKLGGEKNIAATRGDGSELCYLGDQYMRSGDFFAAQGQYKACFEASPKNGVAAMKAGKCLWELNQSTEAIEWMRKAVAADPNLVGAYVLLADYYAQRYDYVSSMQVLQKIQKLQPQSYEVYRGYATVSLRRKDYKNAIVFGQRALKIYDTDLETILIMAKAHIGFREFQEAQRYAARATELDYSSIEAQSLYGKAEAGLRGVDSGALYVQSLINRYVVTKNQQIPKAAIELRVTLGEIYMQDERLKQAEEAFRQAISLDPDNKPALLGLAGALQAQNLPPQALEMFLKAAVLDPSDADPIYRSGQLYAEVGKMNEA